MAFEYWLVEDEIIAALIAALPDGYVVIALPEKQKDYQQVNAKAMLVVAYSDSDFDTSESTDVVRQNETVNFIINIRSKNLRGDFGIHEAVRFLKIILQGLKSDYLSGRVELKKVEFDNRDEENNWFSYNMKLSATKPQVQTVIDGEVPTLTEVIINNQFST